MPAPRTSTLSTLEGRTDLAGVRVLVRASLNVPIENGAVRNQFRLRRMLPTLTYLRAHGAKTTVIGHIGREQEATLAPVHGALAALFGEVSWCDTVVGADARATRDSLSNGDVLLLENLRSVEGERANDEEFARELAQNTDLFVNDAFAASHRAHASIVGVPQYVPSCIGVNFKEEIDALTRARTPQHPSLFVLGGAKFKTKQPLIAHFLSRYEHVFVGGALAHDIWRARGYELGTSLIGEEPVTDRAIIDAPNLMLPTDVVVTDGEYTRVTTPDDVHENEAIYDAGPETVTLLSSHADAARTILFNGPLGNYERGFQRATVEFATALANTNADTIVGGGDTIASISEYALEHRFSFLSTAGGAMLTFLRNGTLPGIEAIEEVT